MLSARRLGRGVGERDDAVELAEQGALLSPGTQTTAASELLARAKQPSTANAPDWRRGYPHQDGQRIAASKIGPQTRIYLLAGCLFGLACFVAVLVVPSVMPDTVDALRDEAICASCLALIIPLQALARQGDDAFTRTIVGFCIELKIQDGDICTGAVGSQAPILAHVLRSISSGSQAAQMICSYLVEVCPTPEIPRMQLGFTKPRSLPHVRRDLDLPSTSPDGQSRFFQVAHFSDVHVDRKYMVNSSADCSKVICCRDYGPGSVGPQVTNKAGPYGAPTCDSPPALADSMLRAMKTVAPDRAFSIFTGDAVDDAVWDAEQSKIKEDLRAWYRRYDSLSAPVYSVFGNHDGVPVNSFPTWSGTQAEPYWLYEDAALSWNRTIGSEAAADLAALSGCYSRVHPGTKLRIISVNTNYWYKQNFWLYDSDAVRWDPNGILTWLTRELDEAEQMQQRAWIIGHIPTGSADILMAQANYASQIYHRYRDTIAAHFYGHTHSDTFAIAYSDYSNRVAENAEGIAYICGALTPMSGAPTFRVYDVHPESYEVMDFRVYRADYTEPQYQLGPNWLEPYYSARESYGSYLDPPWPAEAGLNATFWSLVVDAFERNDEAYELYNQRLSRGLKAGPCTDECKRNTLCQLRTLSSEHSCWQSLNMTFSSRDEIAALNQACTGPGLGSMLQAVGNSHMSEFAKALLR